MRVRHPYSLDDDAPPPDATVHYGGRREKSPVDEDGTFEVPDEYHGWLDRFAEMNGYDAEDLLVDEYAESGPSGEASDDRDVCTEEMSNGEECGRVRPCQYHD